MIKKFENYMSREEMCRVLCRNGYEMHELDECSNQELEEMCKNCSGNQEENQATAYESKSENSMTRDEMCRMLCKNGYEMHELEECSNQELQEMCRNCKNQNSESSAYEAKSEKWIQDAIKNPGSLRKQMGKKEGEKIKASEINTELKELKAKDKDKSKKGVQGLSKSDLAKFRKLNLAKTLKGLKEHQETQNYMFFANLQTLKRLVDGMLEMDEAKVDAILTDGHGWALDHIATSKDDVEEVFNFLSSHDEPEHKHEVHYSEPSHEETEGHLANKDLEDEMKNIKSFGDFKK
jgi:hypothetical protein